MCILILCWPTTYLYIKILLSDPNFLVTPLQRRSKILYDVIFVHLKNEKKLFFFQQKRPFFKTSNRPRQFFSILLWHLINFLLSNGLTELVRVRTKHTSTLGEDHIKINNFDVFDGGVRVRNEFFIPKLVNVCY